MKTAPITSTVQAVACPFGIATAMTVLCYFASGSTLGFYLGPIAIAALLVPPIASSKSSTLKAVAIVDAIALIWFVAIFLTSATFAQWLACYLILIAFAFATFALSRTLGGPLVALLAIAWLAWPVWMSAYITRSLAVWLAPAHPLLAINHVMLDLGVWTQERLMYQFTALGQDVPYALPRTIWPCVVLHIVIGLTPLLLVGKRAVGWPIAGWRGRSSASLPSA